MLLAIEGVAGSGKSTIRDRLLTEAAAYTIPLGHIGQFSWLSLPATRTIISLRAGTATVSEADAVAAVRTDLLLHAQHNVGLARVAGHVVADRLLLSTVCLLSLIYDAESSPRTWGCSGQITGLTRAKTVLPTHVGVLRIYLSRSIG